MYTVIKCINHVKWSSELFISGSGKEHAPMRGVLEAPDVEHSILGSGYICGCYPNVDCYCRIGTHVYIDILGIYIVFGSTPSKF